MPRPSMFIGSSAEGLPYAKAIQQELDRDVECIVWSQGIFGLSEGTLQSLVDAIPKLDYAVLVLTPDDLAISRGEEFSAPRDNVLLEAGIFIGSLSAARTYFVVDRSCKMKLPSDLAGISVATFEPPVSGTHQSAIGAACSEISFAVKRFGNRDCSKQVELSLSGTFSPDGSGFEISITNKTDRELIPYQAELFHPDLGFFSFFLASSDGLQYSGQ